MYVKLLHTYMKQDMGCTFSESDETKFSMGSLQRMTSRSARQCKFQISTSKVLLVVGALPLLFALLLL